MLYVYGIVRDHALETVKTLTGIGTPPASVMAIRANEYDIIVSEFTHLNTLNANDALTHSKVLGDLFEETTVIPVKFGTTVSQAADLVAMIDADREQLEDEFRKLKGHLEVGIKIYWEQKALQTQVLKHIDLTQAQKNSARTAEGLYALEIQVGQIAEQIIGHWRDTFSQAVADLLEPLADDVVIGKLISIYMLYNVSFLISRNRQEAFQKQVYKLEENFGTEFRIHYVDNLPPFNFVNLKLGSPADGKHAS